MCGENEETDIIMQREPSGDQTDLNCGGKKGGKWRKDNDYMNVARNGKRRCCFSKKEKKR